MAGFRLARHHLLGRASPDRLVDVVSDLGGVHAQLMSSAELSLAARIDGLAPEDVRDALWDRRELVKTWAMRGTLHLLPAAELPMYTAALARRDHWSKGAWLRGHGVTAEQIEAIIGAIPRALGAAPRTREELADTLGIDVRELVLSGWGAVLKPSAFRGDLCFGPNRGRNVTFVRPRDWLDGWAAVDPEEAERELARRYLRAYGPATREDFGRWFPGAWARLFRSLAGELADVDVDGRSAHLHVDDLSALTEAASPRSVRLLPAFDAYVVACRPRERLVPADLAGRVYRPQGWISPVLRVDGRIAGVWRHEKRRGAVEIDVEPFRRSTRTRELRDEADRVGAFFRLPVRLRVASAGSASRRRGSSA